MPLAFLLTDEAFAVAQQRYAAADALEHKHWYFFGAALTMYLNWQLCTLIGLVFGQAVPNLASWGLDFAMLATLIGILMPRLRNRPQLAAAVVAGLLALACRAWPYQLGLLTAACGGILAGALLENRRAVQALVEDV
jgi:predicted branched-subunit amino acid permease